MALRRFLSYKLLLNPRAMELNLRNYLADEGNATTSAALDRSPEVLERKCQNCFWIDEEHKHVLRAKNKSQYT